GFVSGTGLGPVTPAGIPWGHLVTSAQPLARRLRTPGLGPLPGPSVALCLESEPCCAPSSQLRPSQTPLTTSQESLDFSGSLEQASTERVLRAGKQLHRHLLAACPGLIRDRKHHLRLYRQCCSGRELVDGILALGLAVHSRSQAVGVCQVLLDEGALCHVRHDWAFQDRDAQFYRFPGPEPEPAGRPEVEEDLLEAVALLAQRGPDALLTVALRKPPAQRTHEELELIFEELLHIKAVAHLSNSVKRELAAVLLLSRTARRALCVSGAGPWGLGGGGWPVLTRASCSVQPGGQGHLVVHHLEGVRQRGHPWQGELRLRPPQQGLCGPRGCCPPPFPCVLAAGAGDHPARGRRLWTAGPGKRRPPRGHHRPAGGQLSLPARGQAGLQSHHQGASCPGCLPMEWRSRREAQPGLGPGAGRGIGRAGQLGPGGQGGVALFSRTWKRRPCGWKSTARWCWCWREPPRAPALLAPRPQAGPGTQAAPPSPVREVPLSQPRPTPGARLEHLGRAGGSMVDVCRPGVGEWRRDMVSAGPTFPRYTVMSGTPEKILELLLEAMRPDSSTHDPTGRSTG
uniref:DEP domain-containing protein n=1 Tax=Oryctolagus cuniculus TaxID=9986 RepID=A0A5F9D049_RABIT